MHTVSKGGEVVAGRYRLVERLGAGGMGTVWRATDELLEREVALKEIGIPSGLPDAEIERQRRRYLREARAAARLQHENVVVVHDVISEANTVWIVMELLECPDLAAIVKDDGPLTPAEVARIGLHILDALVAAHAAGVLHRDVKPANVLIMGSGRAVLTDFGVASVAGDASLTATGQLIGSPAYLAPERLTGEQAGPPSDLWSLGCTMYAAVEGVSPFWRSEAFEILSAITVEALLPPQHAGKLAPVLYGLLEKDPAQRWDAERTRSALERVAAGLQVAAAPGWGAPGHGPTGETTEVRGPSSGGRSDAATSRGSGAVPSPRAAAGSSGRVTMGAAAVVPSSPQAATSEAVRPSRRRRRIVLTVVLVLLATALGAAAVLAVPPVRELIFGAPADADTEQYPFSAAPDETEFVHPQHDYRLSHPRDWAADCQSEQLCRFSTDSATNASGATTLNLFVEVRQAKGSGSLELTKAYHRKLAGDPKNFPGYRRLVLEKATRGSYVGTVHEFTFDHPVNGARRVLIFRTVSSDVSFELSLNGPADRFVEEQWVYDRVLESFRLPG